MNKYENFKKRGPFRMEKALVAVLIAIITILIIIPRNEDKHEKVEQTTIFFLESVEVPQVELEDLNIPAPKPVIPVMSEDEDIDLSVTLEDMDFSTYELADDPPPPGEISENNIDHFIFIPREVEPTPVGGYQAIINNVEYPDIPREAGIEGTVVVQCYIDEHGRVIKTIVIKGLPGTGLDEAAMDALKMTKFKPAIQRDKPVGVWLAIPVIFKLN